MVDFTFTFTFDGHGLFRKRVCLGVLLRHMLPSLLLQGRGHSYRLPDCSTTLRKK